MVNKVRGRQIPIYSSFDIFKIILSEPFINQGNATSIPESEKETKYKNDVNVTDTLVHHNEININMPPFARNLIIVLFGASIAGLMFYALWRLGY